jgi:hypothetical protein
VGQVGALGNRTEQSTCAGEPVFHLKESTTNPTVTMSLSLYLCERNRNQVAGCDKLKSTPNDRPDVELESPMSVEALRRSKSHPPRARFYLAHCVPIRMVSDASASGKND